MSNVVPSPNALPGTQLVPDRLAGWPVALHVVDWQQHLRQRASNWLPDFHSAIEALYANCSVDGWDGPNSLGVARAAADNALRLLDWVYYELPEGIPAPAVGAAPDGEISIDWAAGARWIISLNIGAHENVNYAGQFPDGKTQHGYMPYGVNAVKFQAAVSELCLLIRRLYSA